MAALCNRAGHYIFALWILLSSIFLFFSSPNLSRRRLDVCNTSTHGVALVRIYDAGLKLAARGSLKIQDFKITKSSPSAHQPTDYRAIEKKTVKQQSPPHVLTIW